MKRFKHSLSNQKLLSMNMGPIVPIGLTEVLPGDSIQQATTVLIRVSPLLAPVMHNVKAHIRHFFVPHRLVWEDWEDFITGGPDGLDSSAFPYVTSPSEGGFTVGSLADYLGVDTGVADIEVSALPFRGMALIWNEYFRDQDLQTEESISVASGEDSTIETLQLYNPSWEKDYFTTSRPWAQKGPSVTVPVERVSSATTWTGYNSGTDNVASNGGVTIASGTGELTSVSGGMSLDPNGGLVSSIPELRTAFALYRYQEARARYGSRYTEYLRYLGVRSSDARLQRPEYLGGGVQSIQFSEVLQTAPDSASGTSGTTGVGDLKGHGIGAMRSNRYRRFFEEHGYVFTLIYVRPRNVYAMGTERHWWKRTKEDFYQKELQHIGQQEVFAGEVRAVDGMTTNMAAWGYQDRYAEYMQGFSKVHGEFRTDLDYWHMARIYGGSTVPTLNGSFVELLPTERIYADATSDNLWVMVNNSIQARRIVSPNTRSFVF